MLCIIYSIYKPHNLQYIHKGFDAKIILVDYDTKFNWHWFIQSTYKSWHKLQMVLIKRQLLTSKQQKVTYMSIKSLQAG